VRFVKFGIAQAASEAKTQAGYATVGRDAHMRSQSRPMAKIGPMGGGFGSSLAQRRLRPTPIGAVLLAPLGLRCASSHSAAFAPAVQRSWGGAAQFSPLGRSKIVNCQ